MIEERINAWLALSDSGLAASVLNGLLEALDDPEAVIAAKDATLLQIGLSTDQVRRLREAAGDRIRRKRQLEVLDSCDIRLMERGGAEWPARLEEIPNPPPVLYFQGTPDPADALAVALVGPRAATPYGLEVARRLATEFAPILTVISGLAVGIDSTAHDAVLRAGGRTVGVAACGLDSDYPRGTSERRRAIIETGALLSLWPPLTTPRTHHFPQRNVLIAALSLAVIVVEAGEKSGALVTARSAAELGRDVFAVPGDITRLNSRGSNALLREGAAVCTRAADVLEALEMTLLNESEALRARRGETDAPSADAAPTPDGHEGRILAVLRHSERQYDDLMAELVPGAMTLGEFAGALLQLEIKGLVTTRPGRIYAPR